jgi:hypothetical protein
VVRESVVIAGVDCSGAFSARFVDDAANLGEAADLSYRTMSTLTHRRNKGA